MIAPAQYRGDVPPPEPGIPAEPRLASFATDEWLRDAKLLVVDDEAANTRLLERLLARAGFRNVRAVNSADAAEAECQRSPPDLLLLDVHMPGRNGLELLGDIRSSIATRVLDGLVPVIVITGDPSRTIREEAERLGARDFLTKPFDMSELLLRIESLLALRLLHDDVIAGDTGSEAGAIGPRELAFIDRLANISQYFDGTTAGHNDRVGALSERIALAIGLTCAEAAAIGGAARLHDVGKLGVRDEILLKRGVLSDFELDLARRHTIVGALMLAGSKLPLLHLASRIALSHHERWDGTGYPYGTVGCAIPLPARIVAVADVFDALTHDRPYKGAWTETAAVAEIALGRGTQFDPVVVDAFMRVLQNGVQLEMATDGADRRDAVGASAAGRTLGADGVIGARRELRRLGLVGREATNEAA